MKGTVLGLHHDDLFCGFVKALSETILFHEIIIRNSSPDGLVGGSRMNREIHSFPYFHGLVESDKGSLHKVIALAMGI